MQNMEQVNPVYEGMGTYTLAMFTMDMICMWITALVKNMKGVDVENMEQINEGMGTYTLVCVDYGHDLYVHYYSSKKWEGSGFGERGASQ